MRLSLKLLAPTALLVAGLAVSSAEAAPAGSGLVPMEAATNVGSVVEKTRWVRRCHRTRHGVHCHRVWVKPWRPHRHRHHRPHRRHHHRFR